MSQPQSQPRSRVLTAVALVLATAATGHTALNVSGKSHLGIFWAKGHQQMGTLFERGLDPDKRSQLGAHYTDRDKIMLIVNPVIVAPLTRMARRRPPSDLLADGGHFVQKERVELRELNS